MDNGTRANATVRSGVRYSQFGPLPRRSRRSRACLRPLHLHCSRRFLLRPGWRHPRPMDRPAQCPQANDDHSGHEIGNEMEDTYGKENMERLEGDRGRKEMGSETRSSHDALPPETPRRALECVSTHSASRSGRHVDPNRTQSDFGLFGSPKAFNFVEECSTYQGREKTSMRPSAVAFVIVLLSILLELGAAAMAADRRAFDDGGGNGGAKNGDEKADDYLTASLVPPWVKVRRRAPSVHTASRIGCILPDFSIEFSSGCGRRVRRRGVVWRNISPFPPCFARIGATGHQFRVIP